MSLLNLLAGLLLIAVSTQPLAGGLSLNEFGTPSMGTAGAGAHALADDASTGIGVGVRFNYLRFNYK